MKTKKNNARENSKRREQVTHFMFISAVLLYKKYEWKVKKCNRECNSCWQCEYFKKVKNKWKSKCQ